MDTQRRRFRAVQVKGERNCKSFTFSHTLIIHLFVIYLQNPTDSSAFLQSPFARMAELVDALDSKSNVLKKTCRFEPGFGHKKR